VKRKGGSFLIVRLRPLDHGRVAVFVSDPLVRATPDPGTLELAFELTTAEAELASALATGLSLSQCAQQRRVSLHTVRSQLKQIFTKTGTSRQTDLVRLLLATTAPVHTAPLAIQRRDATASPQ